MLSSLAMSVQEPSALRSAMLIAGLHYSWQKGSLQDFESTYLYHKGECIRLVNNWVNDFDTRATADCMQLISTLVLAEVNRSHYYSSRECADSQLRVSLGICGRRKHTVMAL